MLATVVATAAAGVIAAVGAGAVFVILIARANRCGFRGTD